MKRNIIKLGSVLSGVLASASAFAVDTTAAVTAIEGGNAAVTAIGGAALVVLAGAVVFKYVRRAM